MRWMMNPLNLQKNAQIHQVCWPLRPYKTQWMKQMLSPLTKNCWTGCTTLHNTRSNMATLLDLLPPPSYLGTPFNIVSTSLKTPFPCRQRPLRRAGRGLHPQRQQDDHRPRPVSRHPLPLLQEAKSPGALLLHLTRAPYPQFLRSSLALVLPRPNLPPLLLLMRWTKILSNTQTNAQNRQVHWPLRPYKTRWTRQMPSPHTRNC